jgi:hypothetical protein
LRRLDIESRNAYPVIDVGDDHRIPVPCSGGDHVVTVVGGDLVLLDHEVAAELAMLALGGELPACVVYAALWDEARRGVEFMDAWAVDVSGTALRATAEDWRGNYWESWPSEPPASRVLFARDLQQVLALAVARDWEDEGLADRPERRAVLERAVQQRARRAFVESLAGVDAHRRPDALVPLAVELALDGRAEVRGRLAASGSAVVLRLPPHWLWTTWAVAPVDAGRFVLASGRDVRLVVEWRPADGAVHEPSVLAVTVG